MRNRNQDGFVSIIVASTIMIIITLVVIGFTSLMQREQRQSLDRQLTRQALYAAESGINDVYAKLATTPSLPNKKNDCNPGANPDLQLNPVLNTANRSDIEYTCILYNKNPDVLELTPGVSESDVIQIKSATGVNFTDITFSWRNEDDSNNDSANLDSGGAVACNGDIAPTRNSIPILKIDLTPTTAATYNRNSLIANSSYIYLLPCGDGTGTNTYSYNSANRGETVKVKCDGITGTSFCSLTVNNLGGLAANEYLARIRPIYSAAQVEIRGTLAGGSVATFDGQYSIDVTARAADVVRRLRAAVQLNSVDGPPEAVLHSFDGVCKLLDVDLSNVIVKDGCP